MRFNPPPTWPPAPPGWTPPPGWQPDPSWPPLPPGWPLWLDETKPAHRTALILGALGAVLLIAVGAVVTIAMTRNATAVLSDEEQIRVVVAQFQQAWNDENFTDLQQLVCDEVRTTDDFSQDWLAAAQTEIGRLNLTITDLDITGDTADTVIENDGADPDDIAFVREDGDWKWCEF